MDTWPTNSRTSRSRPSKGRKKAAATSDHLNIEPGLINAARLTEKEGGWMWEFVAGNRTSHKLFASSYPQAILAPTRSEPTSSAGISRRRRTDEDIHFLRTHIPDLDISANFVQEQISTDLNSERSARFDPYDGTVFEHIRAHEKTFLAFSSGETGSHLGIAPILYSDNGNMIIQDAVTVRQFMTPIRSIRLSSWSNTASHPAYTSVRTHGPTWILKNELDSDTFKMEDVASFSRKDLGDRLAMDVLIQTSPLRAIFINDHGHVSHWDMQEGRRAPINALSGASGPIEDQTMPFWKLSETTHPSAFLRSSDQVVERLDVRTNSPPGLLYSITHPFELMTYVDSSSDGWVSRLVTTRELLMMDIRFPKKPLLGILHGRQHDRSLRLCSVSGESATPAFLTSLKDGFVSIYDIDRSSNSASLRTGPYSPLCFKGSNQPHRGHVLIQHPHAGSLSLGQLLHNGGIQFWRLASTLPSPSLSQVLVPVATDAPSGTSSFFSARESLKVDLRQLYEDVTTQISIDMNESSLPTLNKALQSSLETNHGGNSALTSFDRLVQTLEHTTEDYRADFFSQVVRRFKASDYTSVYEQMWSQVRAHSLWRYNLDATFERLDPALTFPPTAEYKLQPGSTDFSDVTPMITSSEKELATDIILSKDVFYSGPNDSVADMFSLDNIISRATKAMSLADEPPPVRFGYLQPLTTNKETTSLSTSVSPAEDDGASTLGVRLLLSGWSISSDPAQYIYTDPYEESITNSPSVSHAVKTVPTVAIPNNPPQIKPMNMQKRVPRGLPTIQSQPPVERETQQTAATLTSSQLIVSTQVLPGPFGGRQVSAKKPVKKRLEGF